MKSFAQAEYEETCARFESLERDKADLLEALKLCINCMGGPRIPKYMQEPVRKARKVIDRIKESQ